MLDLIELVRPFVDCEIHYVYFDLEFEYEATKRHIMYLEEMYGITIARRSPRKSIPRACKDHGVPFFSKHVSEMIERLQRHGFAWPNSDDIELIYMQYPKAHSAIRWWCSVDARTGQKSKNPLSISKNFMMHEFMNANPPVFSISDKCCDYAKKYPGQDFAKEVCADLVMRGMRHSEGGRRAISGARTCFKPGSVNGIDDYCPLWYWSNGDKATYKQWRGLRYSDCYEVYGLTRTGCVGCPFNSKAEEELTLTEPYEPKLAKAARNIFGESYAYRRLYNEFKAQVRLAGGFVHQGALDDFIDV